MLPHHRDIIANAMDKDILTNIKDESRFHADSSTENIAISLRGARVLGRYVRRRFKTMSLFNKIMTGMMFFEPIASGVGALTDNGEAELPEYKTIKNIILALNEVPEVVAKVLTVTKLPDSSSEMSVFVSRTRLQLQKIEDLGIYLNDETDVIKTKDLPKKIKKNPKDLGYKDESILAISDSFNKVNKYLRSKTKDMRNRLQQVQSQADEIVDEIEKLGDIEKKEENENLLNKKKALMANANALKFKAKLADQILSQAADNVKFVREAISELESQYDKKVFKDQPET